MINILICSNEPEARRGINLSANIQGIINP